MKKIILVLVVMIGFGFIANAQERYAENNNLLAYVESTSSTTIDILVSANQYVDDLCNYFDGSLADYGLKIYCKFGGDVYTCTAYKVVKYACAVNGAVRLYIEGDTDAALIRLFNGFSPVKVYNLTKENGNYYIKG